MIFEKQILDFYRSIAYTRCDDKGTAHYFSAADFDGLHRDDYEFNSSLGHKLCGNIYFYDNYNPHRLVIFDHGFGGGHRSYMKEIEMLCRHGYRVFAYDHTGCMESGGESPNGMAQSLCDLNDCINALKSDEQFRDLDFSVMGHSWGGFSCLNIAALHPDISHIVVLSGFVSVEEIVNTFFSGVLKGYRKAVMALERKSNPEFVKYNAVESLSKTDAKVLLVYSDNDKTVKKSQYDMLKSALEGKENIKFILEYNKGHNPNYTYDAVEYFGKYYADVQKKTRKKLLETDEQKKSFVASFDWNAITEQDESVWNEIFEVLDK
ncbi:MAG: alpha/beta fold hydrolase [Clostridia bacterium]|nr:alpha/beta fold hydrolase [Clostridia bacterium]